MSADPEARSLDIELSATPPITLRPRNAPPLTANPRIGIAASDLARHGLLDAYLRQLVIAEAVASIALTEDEQKQALLEWCEARELEPEPEAIQRHALSHGLQPDDPVWQAELPLRIERHCREHYLPKAETRFLERKTRLDRVIYSLLRVKEAHLARELYLRIAEGEASFADLAATYALGPERATNGVVGPVPLLQAHPALAELLRTSRPGQLRQPIRISDWWLVVRLESYTPATLDEDLQLQLAQELFQEWVEEQIPSRLQRIVAGS
ncbi:MAG: peptidylprolyl isomerase [Cyanobacteria bacterium M_surface_10_m1_298]|nr:peptidylprolyl isomerase [Cyanobacteria bacterium M_surface_10_m1_298]